MLRRRFQVLLLATAVLAVYYRSIFSELNSIDDVEMVTGMLNTEHWSLRGLFFPKGGIGLYYRPILGLSFLLDKELWFMESSFMHLENILLHLLNALLVFILALKLLPEREQKTSYLPLIAALCFALHPITTESVNWVSGRTDLMACSFLLLCALSLLLFKLKQQYWYLFGAILALLCATLTKEVSLAFFLGAFFLLNARTSSAEASPEGRLKRIAPQLMLLGLLGAASAVAWLYLHTHPYKYDSSKVRMTLRFIFDDPYNSLFICLRTFGFYLKKLYWPFPLNFAIMEVDPLYELLAMPIALGCSYLAARRSLVSATFLAGACMIIPAFLPAFNQVAWTPYAERYVYIASAFVMIASVLFLGTVAARKNLGFVVKAGIPCLIGIMGIATFQRSLVWQTNLNLYTDTVAKSPGFSKAWNQLGLAYYDKKDFLNAEACFAKASVLYSYLLVYDERTDLNHALVLSKYGKTKEAEEVYRMALKKSDGRSAKVLEHYIEFLIKKMASEKRAATVVAIKGEILTKTEMLYALNGDASTLYRAGALALDIGDRRKAVQCFSKLYDKFPEENRYKKLSKEQLARL